jgi:hypothetical protein
MSQVKGRPLVRAAMVGRAGLAVGMRHETGDETGQSPPASMRGPADGPIEGAASEANRIDALTKLKGLLDTGVLTQEQYDSEHARLTEGI